MESSVDVTAIVITIVCVGVTTLFGWVLIHTTRREIHLNPEDGCIKESVCDERVRRIDEKLDEISGNVKMLVNLHLDKGD